MPFCPATVPDRHGVFPRPFLNSFRDPLEVADGDARVDLIEKGSCVQDAQFEEELRLPAAPTDAGPSRVSRDPQNFQAGENDTTGVL